MKLEMFPMKIRNHLLPFAILAWLVRFAQAVCPTINSGR